MIYSASRRTDMVAFFPDAIADKVRRSRKLDAIVFWTKDPRHLVDHPDLDRIVRHIPSVVQLTITGLAGGPWEPNVPPPEALLPSLAKLAAILPKGAIRWRFDPVMASEDVDRRFHSVKTALESALGRLDEVTTSFPDPYRKAVERSAAAGLAWPTASPAEKRRIVSMMAHSFAGFPDASPCPVKLCCEPALLSLPGVGQAHCIDGLLFEKLYGPPLGGLAKDGGQRAACGCVVSTDIGSYAMRCPHRCLYCYANPE